MPRQSCEPDPEVFPYANKCRGKTKQMHWGRQQYNDMKKKHEDNCTVCRDYWKQEEKLKAGQRVKVGKFVRMLFKKTGWHNGTITNFDPATKKYTVIFLDGTKYTTKIPDADVEIVP